MIRHELGHIVHGQIHHRERDATCGDSDNYRLPTTSYNRNCEYGSTATKEGIPNFIAVRSIVDNSNKAFYCKCLDPVEGSGANLDLCSELAQQSTSDPDGDSLTDCVDDGIQRLDISDYFAGVGDYWSVGPSTCVRLRADEACDCNASPCNTSDYQSMGWRNPIQIMRFLWDMVDTPTDGGLDDATYSIGTFVSSMESMPCAGSKGGVDGSCEEQAVPVFPLCLFPPCTCNPASDGATTPSGTGTRDSYNMYDIAEVLPNNENAERTLNCVQGAPD